MIKNDSQIAKIMHNPANNQSLRLSFISRNDKIAGYVMVDYNSNNNSLNYGYTIFNSKNIYNKSFTEKIKSKSKKSINKDNFKLQKITDNNFNLNINHKPLSLNIEFSNPYHNYEFNNTSNSNTIPQKICIENTSYRSLAQTKLINESSNIEKNISAIGFIDHLTGTLDIPNLKCLSNVVIHMKDKSIFFKYINTGIDEIYFGSVMKKNSILGMINIEFESFNYNVKNKKFESSEFTYKDAQDDIDLVVSKSNFNKTLENLEIKNKNTFYHILSYSDFHLIGGNKKGFGFEEHYITQEMIDSLQ